MESAQQQKQKQGHRRHKSLPINLQDENRITYASKETQTSNGNRHDTTFTIQIFHLHKGETIRLIEEELKAELKSLCHAPIDFINRRQHSDIETSQILIVLSIQASRVGADAEYAIKDIKNHSNVALVMVHKKEAHVLPKHKSTDILTDHMFNDFGGIFDLAFSTERGIYTCEMNEDTLEGICTFIMKNVELPSTTL